MELQQTAQSRNHTILKTGGLGYADVAARYGKLDLANYPILSSMPHAKMSERYAHIPTLQPVEVLRDNGWIPRAVSQATTRAVARAGFQSHIVRLYNPNMPIMSDGAFPEILLKNSYDGSSSFELMIGFFRMVCYNGLIVGDTFQTSRIRHTGYASIKVENALRELLPGIERVCEATEQFKRIELAPSEQKVLAEEALNMRFDGTKYVVDDRAVANVLNVQRHADQPKTLWNTYNVIQENIIKRGFRSRKLDKNGVPEFRATKVRAIKGLDQDTALNKALWSLTEKMAALKTGIAA